MRYFFRSSKTEIVYLLLSLRNTDNGFEESVNGYNDEVERNGKFLAECRRDQG